MKVVWTPEANQDRLEILEYIATDNPRAAARMDQLFIDAAGQLGEFPKLGRSGKIPNTRELIPHESYRLIYEVDEAAKTVWVLVLIHTARQWPPVQK
ncbi:type II toxin-antitoxin system RelE/ParE family toxin [Aquamicrobium sp. NLF2-7]|uniref:type II toxin-antitoxin system RelE/ParE family toxin n=1 Tax=Aquamicrobium sp. NLF2-7 TaxID=2918753 RepID=UPI001EFB9318|nr:type II toxin-antitoxin system RelE/ParE family toxin [Aquamicrobium sp. NLF2-7]